MVAPPTSRGTAQPTSSSSANAALPSPTVPVGSGATAIEGEVIETQYGSAQVRVLLSGQRIADVEPMLLPSETKRSMSISNAVEPWLRRRAIAAQAAQFDVLSGATYTSRGYMASLETALRSAGLEHP